MHIADRDPEGSGRKTFQDVPDCWGWHMSLFFWLANLSVSDDYEFWNLVFSDVCDVGNRWCLYIVFSFPYWKWDDFDQDPGQLEISCPVMAIQVRLCHGRIDKLKSESISIWITWVPIMYNTICIYIYIFKYIRVHSIYIYINVGWRWNYEYML